MQAENNHVDSCCMGGSPKLMRKDRIYAGPSSLRCSDCLASLPRLEAQKLGKAPLEQPCLAPQAGFEAQDLLQEFVPDSVNRCLGKASYGCRSIG